MATAFKIESGVPVPTYLGPGQPEKYPFSQMAVGDSFVAGEYSATLLNSVRSCAQHQERRHSRRFIARKHGNDLRVWRIA